MADAFEIEQQAIIAAYRKGEISRRERRRAMDDHYKRNFEQAGKERAEAYDRAEKQGLRIR